MNIAGGRQTGLPRYLEIANELRHRVASGIWGVGDRLPSNKELADDFAVTAVTAREAVKYLESRGVLDCRRGAGTFVSGKLPQIQGVALNPDLTSVVAAIGDGEIVELPEPDEATEPALPAGLIAAPSYQRLTRLTLNEGQPLMVADVWLSTDIFNQNPGRFSTAPALPLLMEMRKGELERASQIMTVEPASPVVADALRLMPWSLVASMQANLSDPSGVVVYSGTLRFPAEAVRIEFA